MNITLWHIIGLAGTLAFSGRWLYQMWESKKAGKPVVTRGFWYISIFGNVLILSYFIFGHPDPIGVLSNLFPMGVALYNLGLAISSEKKAADTKSAAVK